MSLFTFSMFFFNLAQVSCVLWFFTLLVFFLNTTFVNKHSETQYECGFKTTTKNNLSITFNAILSCIFVFLYELEFLLILPLAFYSNTLHITTITPCVFFIGLVVSFWLDLYSKTITWRF